MGVGVSGWGIKRYKIVEFYYFFLLNNIILIASREYLNIDALGQNYEWMILKKYGSRLSEKYHRILGDILGKTVVQ